MMGGRFLKGTVTPTQTSQSGPMQPFLGPVTVCQALGVSDEGVQVDTQSVTMVKELEVSLLGAVSCTEITSTNIRFCLSDDRGVIDCFQWLEDCGQFESALNVEESSYFRVYRCINSIEGQQGIMVFKTLPVMDFSEIPTQSENGLSAHEHIQITITPVQREILDAIKDIGTEVGWSKHDPNIKRRFSSRQIQDALDFLVGEGHIYTTVDDDHFCSA